MDDDDDSNIKLADFGLATRITDDSAGLTHVCGTAGYAAPEIFDGSPYGKPVDMYAVGAVAFGLVGGYPPFDGDTDDEIIALSRLGTYEFESPYWDEVSAEGRDFIARLLSVNPSDRLTASEALLHPWVRPVVSLVCAVLIL